MAAKTISLFRYLLLGILNRRLLALVAVLFALSLAFSGFVGELAIINSAEISRALLADFLRYCLVVLLLLVVTVNVAEDYQLGQFERLLTMPIARWQYVVAQVFIVAALAFMLCLLVFGVTWLGSPLSVALYWSAAVWLELMLVGMVGLLAILSLEKVPLAVFFSIAIYLLSKLSGLITQMLAESVRLSDGSIASRVSETVFGTILYVIPGIEAYAQNDVFFENADTVAMLAGQFSSALVYLLFLLFACLVDFYRKEFNC